MGSLPPEVVNLVTSYALLLGDSNIAKDLS